MHEETGAPASDIARAYTVAREVFGMRPQWDEIEALDNSIAAELQVEMLLEGRRLVERGTRWLLRNRRRPLNIAATVEHFAPGAEVLYDSVARLLGGRRRPVTQRAAELEAGGRAGRRWRARVAGLADVLGAGHRRGRRRDRTSTSRSSRRSTSAWGACSSCTGCATGSSTLPRDDRWSALARAALRDDLYASTGRSPPRCCETASRAATSRAA